ncbi:uncharacterized protein LOC111315160 [Durio zibethinus]|uniref:Uncharacterized protein LOC111315160 n=1 Tax=Durio zibethinus TaxID=66656 RepID=A0A6P6B5N8_DURZI|nr:uncharacterized protein LOC111315160 [Durio zibethinus]
MVCNQASMERKEIKEFNGGKSGEETSIQGCKDAANEGMFSLKLNMSKAYDRVEWNSLKGMTGKIGFYSRWVDIIVNCVTTVSYSIVVNRCITDSFNLKEDLRQGDSLSLYLFLICSEGLSALLAKNQRKGFLLGIQASQSGPRVTHLFFADDSFPFTSANRSESERVKHVLQRYEDSSGQTINFDKSALYFSSNTTETQQEEIKEAFGVQITSKPEKYLGLPSMVGRDRKRAFRGLKDRISSRLASWSNKTLSLDGKECNQQLLVEAWKCEDRYQLDELETDVQSKNKGGNGI